MNKRTKRHTIAEGILAWAGFGLICTGCWLVGPVLGCIVTGMLLCAIVASSNGREKKGNDLVGLLPGAKGVNITSTPGERAIICLDFCRGVPCGRIRQWLEDDHRLYQFDEVRI